MKTVNVSLAATLISLAAGLMGCATLIDSRTEAIITSELPRLVGPARKYRVDAGGVVPSSGEIKHVRVVGERIARPGAPLIDYAEVDLRDLRVDRVGKRVESVGGADARARLLSADVASFLDGRPGLDAVEVAFRGSDEVLISALPSLAGYFLPPGARVSMRGYLVPDGPRLKLQVADLRAVGFSVGTLPKAALELLVNPIIDLSKLPAPAEITAVRVEGDALVVQAAGVTATAMGTALAR